MIIFIVIIYYSLSKRSLKGSHSVSEGGAMCAAPHWFPQVRPAWFPKPNYFYSYHFKLPLNSPLQLLQLISLKKIK